MVDIRINSDTVLGASSNYYKSMRFILRRASTGVCWALGRDPAPNYCSCGCKILVRLEQAEDRFYQGKLVGECYFDRL